MDTSNIYHCEIRATCADCKRVATGNAAAYGGAYRVLREVYFLNRTVGREHGPEKLARVVAQRTVLQRDLNGVHRMARVR